MSYAKDAKPLQKLAGAGEVRRKMEPASPRKIPISKKEPRKKKADSEKE
jgi:hypothetical protein